MRSDVNFSVQIKRSAAKELADIPQPARNRLVTAIDSLREQPLSGAALKGGWKGLRRLRVGTYRIVYELLERQLLVLVVRVGHRRSIYR